MRKITEYCCVTENTQDDLEINVNLLLTKGFTPFGGVCAFYRKGEGIHHEDQIWQAQAMVKYEEKNECGK